jgi:hypothetical protein
MDVIHQLRSADELEKKADIEMHEMPFDGKGEAYTPTSHGTGLTGLQTMRKYWKVSCPYTLLEDSAIKAALIVTGRSLCHDGVFWSLLRWLPYHSAW